MQRGCHTALFSTMIEVKDLVGIGTSRAALLEAGLQQPFVKELLHITT